MFEPIPRSERPAALGIFTAIGLFGVASFQLLITGGFEPIVPRAEASSAPDGPLHVQMVDGRYAGPAYRPTAVATPSSMTFGSDPMLHNASFEELAGDRDGRVSTASMPRDYEDISRDIEALYEESADYRDSAAYEDAAATDYDEASAIDDETPAPSTTIEDNEARKDEFSAYGSASPS